MLPRGGQSDRKKKETVAMVFKNRRDIENGVLPRGGQSDRQKLERWRKFSRIGEREGMGRYPGAVSRIEKKKGTVATVLYLSIIFIPQDLLTH